MLSSKCKYTVCANYYYIWYSILHSTSGSFVIMTTLENGAVKRSIIGNINTALVGQDAHFDLPVREAGMEGEGNVLIYRLKCLEDKGISSRGRFDVMEEGNIDDIDKKRGGKEGNSLIVIIRVREKIQAM